MLIQHRDESTPAPRPARSAPARRTGPVLVLLALLLPAIFAANPSASQGLRAAPAAQGSIDPVWTAHLPTLLRNDPLRRPPDAASATPPLATTPTATATPTGPTPTPVPLPCLPLADRVLLTDIDIAPRTTALRAGRGRWPVAMFLAPHPDPASDPTSPAAWVGWSDGRAAYLTPLDADDQRAGPDIVLDAEEVRGLTVHPDGSPAALLVQGDELRLARFAPDGSPQLDILIIGDNRHNREGDKWSEAFSYESRLVWSEAAGEYGVYAGHSAHFGGNGVHQGDLFWRYDIEGIRIDRAPSWDWGCSHSLDLRLAHNGTRFGPVCLSDIYPAKGFNFGYREALIRAEPSGNGSGSSSARLGGWVPVDDGFLLTFASPEGRPSRDIGLLHVANDGAPSPPTWLTDTRAIDEASPHLARIGTGSPAHFLASWTADDAHHIATVDRAGTFIEQPTIIAPTLAARLDMMTTATGDVLWASAWDELDRLRIIRVTACGN